MRVVNRRQNHVCKNVIKDKLIYTSADPSINMQK
jgi:hypothetical protein